jgi:CRISPR-associated endonuclease cas1, NMENI subtype
MKRVLVFTHPCRLKLHLSQIVITREEEEERKVPIEDVGLLLLEHQQISITLPLLNALADADVAVVICDEEHVPNIYCQSMNSHSLQGEQLQQQIDAGRVLNKQLWQQIISQKIANQAAVLTAVGQSPLSLIHLSRHVKSGDADNKEGQAARTYWPLLMGSDFRRERETKGVNALLNYGYAILRAATIRALISSGLLPALGIFHHHRSNAYPLADDVMEPFRPFVDHIVFSLVEENEMELTTSVKQRLVRVLFSDTIIKDERSPLMIALTRTTASLAKSYAEKSPLLLLPSFVEMG